MDVQTAFPIAGESGALLGDGILWGVRELGCRVGSDRGALP
ncbi:hypothetical protein [Streptosporangium sp. NPDC023615]